MPTFANMGKNWYSDTVPENIELHSPLSVQIQATSPMSRKLIYSIVKGNELEEFAVDFNTGKSLTRRRLEAVFLFEVFTLSTRKFWPMLRSLCPSNTGKFHFPVPPCALIVTLIFPLRFPLASPLLLPLFD